MHIDIVSLNQEIIHNLFDYLVFSPNVCFIPVKCERKKTLIMVDKMSQFVISEWYSGANYIN